MKKVVEKIKKIIFRKKYNRKRAIILFGTIILIMIIILVLSLITKDKWQQNGNIITNGKETYTIGDYYEYDETRKGKYKLEDVKWKVYGIDENNNLLIVSSSSVESLTLGGNDTKTSMNDYIEGTNKLNEIAKKYSKGKKAISARSLNTQDVINLLDVKTEYIEKEKEYTYFWTINKELNYSSLNEGKGKLQIPHKDNFIWFDQNENNWKISEKSIGNITTIKNDLIEFNNKIYNENNKKVFDIEENNNVYRMLFLKDNFQQDAYWLDTKYIDATNEKVSYGYNVIKANTLSSSHIVHSNGETEKQIYGVKILVTIKK